jgi:predicted nucleotidyltransferase
MYHERAGSARFLNIDRTDTIAGYPAMGIRSLLRRSMHRWITVADPVAILGIAEPEGKKLIQELVVLGLLEAMNLTGEQPEGWINTFKGNAFAQVSFRPRFHRATAEAALTDFLKRVVTVESEQRFLYRVDTAIVFGSYLSTAARIGDIDLGVSISPKATEGQKFSDLCLAKTREEIQNGRHFRDWMSRLIWPQVEVLTFLKNRSPILKIHEVDEIAQLGVTRTRTIYQFGEPNPK